MTRNFAKILPEVSGAGLMVLAGAFFAGINLLIQYGEMNLSVPPARMAFWQYFIAFLCALPWLWRHGFAALRTQVPGWHLLRVICSASGVQCWVLGLSHVPIWQAIALSMLSPFFVTLGAGALLGEATPPRRWGAVAVGFGGGMIILAPWSDAFSLWALLPVGAAILWAASSLLIKKTSQSDSTATVTAYLLIGLTPINLALAWPGGLGFNGGGAGWGALPLLLAVGALTALAQYTVNRAYKLADAAYLQPFDNIKLLLNVFGGFVVFGFVPPGSMWLGAALIVGSSSWLLVQETRGADTAPARA